MEILIKTDDDNPNTLFNMLGDLNLKTATMLARAVNAYFTRQEGNAVVVNDKESGIQITVRENEDS